MFAKVMKYVCQGGGLQNIGGSFVHACGFLTDIETRKVSLISCHVADLANRFGWGVDSDLWATRTIYFTNNINSDGRQWARQINHVFIRNERLNWCTQFYARTRGLKGAPREGEKKWCFHRPRCYTCLQKTKCFHTLRLEYQCRTCVNKSVHCM